MPAAPDMVFDEWLDPEALCERMCPRADRCVAVTAEPHDGGRFRFDVEHDGGLVLITGGYLTLEPPQLLRFT